MLIVVIILINIVTIFHLPWWPTSDGGHNAEPSPAALTKPSRKYHEARLNVLLVVTIRMTSWWVSISTSKALRFPALLAIASPNLVSASNTFYLSHHGNPHCHHRNQNGNHGNQNGNHGNQLHCHDHDLHLWGFPCGPTFLTFPLSIDGNLKQMTTTSANLVIFENLVILKKK